MLFGEKIPERSELSDLGVILSDDLRPEPHLRAALSEAGRSANFLARAFVGKIPRVYIKAYTTLVFPILLYASPVWRPWLKRYIKDSLESFQRRFVRRVAFKCDVDPDTIKFDSVSELLDDRDLAPAKILMDNPDFDDFFVRRQTVTRTREIVHVPRAKNNTVMYGFRWRLSKRLSSM